MNKESGLKDKVIGKIKEVEGKVTKDKLREAEGKAQKKKGEVVDRVNEIKKNAEEKISNEVT
ncbi:CsbD family protein [Lactobacillus sp. LL6]|uniref:CsbD family protein n=1 Tax=Lactobacillus sp. LL6 TaxID=2596827 RepID=UPI0011862386|nr:CsbD family protein [Lactobacillus sp. LL6]TSO25522.1 CsbD family protein [Lactobacillus sp. LL6]